MSKHILIVEDEPNIIESLSFLLERAGFDVSSEQDGAMAFDEEDGVSSWRIDTTSAYLGVQFDLSSRLTISTGVACYPRHGSSRDALLDAADKAMYRAKSRGRDCVC